jgi:pimeloyl-ACP methyl ester carboxylesterase
MSATTVAPSASKRANPTVDQAPSLLWFFLELRVFIELIQVWFIAFVKLPKGDGRSVIVYPGLIARDWMTWPLRYALRNAGYDVHGWGLGMNCGPREGVLEACEAKIAQLAQSSGRPVTLIGWSLGGLMARELAKHNPLTVRDVITPWALHSAVHRAQITRGAFINGCPVKRSRALTRSSICTHRRPVRSSASTPKVMALCIGAAAFSPSPLMSGTIVCTAVTSAYPHRSTSFVQ